MSSKVPGLNFASLSNALNDSIEDNGSGRALSSSSTGYRPPSGYDLFGASPDVDTALKRNVMANATIAEKAKAKMLSKSGYYTDRVVYNNSNSNNNSPKQQMYNSNNTNKIRARSATVRNVSNNEFASIATKNVLHPQRPPTAPSASSRNRRLLSASSSRSGSSAVNVEDEGVDGYIAQWGGANSEYYYDDPDEGGDYEENIAMMMAMKNKNVVNSNGNNNGGGNIGNVKQLGEVTEEEENEDEDGGGSSSYGGVGSGSIRNNRNIKRRTTTINNNNHNNNNSNDNWIFKMEQLSRIVSSIGIGKNVNQVIHKAITLVLKLTQSEAGTILLLNKSRNALIGYGPGDVIFRFAANKGIAGHVARSGLSIRTTDAVTAPLTMYDPIVDASTLGVVPKALCAVPMFIPGSTSNPQIYGVLMVANKTNGQASFTAAEEAILTIFGRQLGLALTGSVDQSISREKNMRLRRLDELNRLLAAATSNKLIALAVMRYSALITGADPRSTVLTFVSPNSPTGTIYVPVDTAMGESGHAEFMKAFEAGSLLSPPLLEARLREVRGRSLKAWESNVDSKGPKEHLKGGDHATGPLPMCIGEGGYIIRKENGAMVAIFECSGPNGSVLEGPGFDEGDNDLLPRMISSIGIAIERVEMLDKVTAMKTLVPGLASVLDVENAAKKMVLHTKELLQCPKTALFLLQADNKSAVMLNLDENGDVVEGHEKTVISSNVYPLCDAIIYRHTVCISNTTRDLELRGARWPKILGFKPSQMLVSPVFSADDPAKVIAVLMAFHESSSGNSQQQQQQQQQQQATARHSALHKVQGSFSQADIFMIGSICAEIGPVLEKMTDYEIMVQQNHTLTTAFENVRDLFGELDLPIIVERLNATVRSLLNCAAATIFLVEGLGTREHHGLRIMLPRKLEGDNNEGNKTKKDPKTAPKPGSSSNVMALLRASSGAHKTDHIKEQLQGRVAMEDDITLYTPVGLTMRLGLNDGFAGWCAKFGKFIRSDDPLRDERGAQPIHWMREGKDTRGIMCLPMVGCEKGTILGVVQVENKVSGSFTSQDENYLSFFCSMAAVAIEICGIYPYLRTMEQGRSQVVGRYRCLIEAMRKVSQGHCTSLAHVHAAAVEGSLKITEALAAHVLLCDFESGERELVSLIDGQIIRTPAPTSGFAAHVADNLTPIVAFPASTSPGYDSHVDPPEATTMAALAVPLMRNGISIGAIAVFRRRRAFEDLDRELLQEFGMHIVRSLEQLDLFVRLAWMEVTPHPDVLNLDPFFVAKAKSQAAAVCRAKKCTIFAVDHHAGVLFPFGGPPKVDDSDNNDQALSMITIGEGIAGRVAERGVAVRVEAGDPLLHTMLSKEVDLEWAGEDPQSILCVPACIAGGKTELVLCFADKLDVMKEEEEEDDDDRFANNNSSRLITPGKTPQKKKKKNNRGGGIDTSGFDVRDEVCIKVFSRRLLSALHEGEVRRSLLRGLQRWSSLSQFLGGKAWLAVTDGPSFAQCVLRYLESALPATNAKFFVYEGSHQRYVTTSSHHLAVFDASGYMPLVSPRLPVAVEEVLLKGQVCNQVVPAFGDDIFNKITKLAEERHLAERHGSVTLMSRRPTAAPSNATGGNQSSLGNIPTFSVLKKPAFLSQNQRSMSMINFLHPKHKLNLSHEEESNAVQYTPKSVGDPRRSSMMIGSPNFSFAASPLNSPSPSIGEKSLNMAVASAAAIFHNNNNSMSEEDRNNNHNLQSTTIVEGDESMLPPPKMVNVLCGPILNEQGEVIGAIMVSSVEETQRFSSEDEDFMATFCSCVSSSADSIRATVEVFH